MDLTHIGADLFGVTESRVLRALARLADPVSGRHLAKLAGDESHSTVQRYLHKLRKIGLVEATETPAATLYRLNRGHVFWRPIEEVLSASARVEQEVVELIVSELGTAARVAAFGSVAAGTSDAESDYDLLIVTDESVSREDRTRVAAEVSELVETLSGNPAHVIDVSTGELRELDDHGSPLVDEWKKFARPLDGRGRIPELQSAP